MNKWYKATAFTTLATAAILVHGVQVYQLIVAPVLHSRSRLSNVAPESASKSAAF